MKKLHLLAIAALLLTFFANACKEKNPEPSNEEELVTTVRLRFTDATNSSVSTFTYRDLDGAGGNAPTIDNIVLIQNRNYTLTIEVLNESGGKTEDITSEILTEGEEHQFFFSGTVVANGALAVTYNDRDKAGRPIGLNNQVSTRAANSGDFVVTLRHDLNKAATGVAAGNIANAGGETDIETKFNVSIR